MKIEKIDANLLNKIEILENQKPVECFVFGKKDCIKRFAKENGIHILCEYLFIDCFLLNATKTQIFDLSMDKNVKYICSNPTATSMMFLSKKILNLGSTQLTGEGVGVAFIDTGVSNHCDFMIGKNRIEFFKDFVGEKSECYDDNGHGTFVCGVCSGNGALSNRKYSGIAPKSRIFALKALAENGEATARRILDAMEWIYDNHKKSGIKVVCMSFGSEPIGINDPIMIGAEALWEDGVVVVSAAGNSGPEFQTIKSPGVSSKIITVGGIDDNRYEKSHFESNFFEIAPFSSRGPAFKRIKPDVVAPSVDIISCGNKKYYQTMSGTSVATPMIAGLCCLLLEKDASLVPNQIKYILQKNSVPLGFEKNMEGFGLPNLKKFI